MVGPPLIYHTDHLQVAALLEELVHAGLGNIQNHKPDLLDAASVLKLTQHFRMWNVNRRASFGENVAAAEYSQYVSGLCTAPRRARRGVPRRDFFHKIGSAPRRAEDRGAARRREFLQQCIRVTL